MILTSNAGMYKPYRPTPIDWSHASTRGLRVAHLFNSWERFPLNLGSLKGAGYVKQDGGASLIWQMGQRGPRLVYTNTMTENTSFEMGAAAVLLPLNNCTILFGYRKTDATLRSTFAFTLGDWSNWSGTNRFSAHIPWSDGNVYWCFGTDTCLGASGLTFGDDVWCMNSGPRGQEIWQNGALRASNGSNPTRTSLASTFRLGGIFRPVFAGGDIPSDLCEWDFFYLWERQLAIAEIVYLSHYPFDLCMTSYGYHLAGSVASGLAAARSKSMHPTTDYGLHT
jgi:hypothetical protein